MSKPPFEFDFGRPGLIWGVHAVEGKSVSIEDCNAPVEGGLRWLHLNLSDQWTQNWIEQSDLLGEDVRELLLATDADQRAIIEGDSIGFVLNDFERDFDSAAPPEIGVLRFALTPNLMLTTRRRPVRSADIVYRRVRGGTGLGDIGDALDVLLDALGDVTAGQIAELAAIVQKAEDNFLDGRPGGTMRDQLAVRRRIAKLHRMLGGMRSVFHRLEREPRITEPLAPVIAQFAQRLDGLDADTLALQTQLRQLREEVDLQANQKTNENLYVLSIMTALMLPATFVTGFFGMNTGGLPLVGDAAGTIYAGLMAVGSAAAAYFILLKLGLARR